MLAHAVLVTPTCVPLDAAQRPAAQAAVQAMSRHENRPSCWTAQMWCALAFVSMAQREMLSYLWGWIWTLKEEEKMENGPT